MAQPDAPTTTVVAGKKMEEPHVVSGAVYTQVRHPISDFPVEILIEISEKLHVEILCAFSCVSKQFAVAAQDVLYRSVDLRPEHPRHSMLEQKSGIAMLAWTLNRKPHLAAKI
ncbi:F-box multi-domain protein [Pyrenophora tritici-repentis]|nr:hypothetical protein Alg130_00628 [Pyrenophora tritici-repentis]KAI0607693.1 F-box multi-domain protein [Pyrenophora tritici-repentis]KAI0626815.1 F-box multi-domain protein [Pyrenophora tritici-repentis]